LPDLDEMFLALDFSAVAAEPGNSNAGSEWSFTRNRQIGLGL
jgi:hypothetical protein